MRVLGTRQKNDCKIITCQTPRSSYSIYTRCTLVHTAIYRHEIITSRPFWLTSHIPARSVATTAAASITSDNASFEADATPAFDATLRLLEWERLCHHVAGFAQTTLGQRACCALRPPPLQAASEALLAETRAVQSLEGEYAVELEFGGIQTAPASDALRRASRGGMLTGQALQAVASLPQGAAKLQRSIGVAARQAEASGHTALAPVWARFKDLLILPDLSSEIGFSIQENGTVRETASDEVKKAAGKVRTIEGRLRGVLRSLNGEVTDMGGRMCAAVPMSAGAVPPKGILLGTAPGGSAWYIESPAAVPLNNDLIAARAELTVAEEAVLWRLTGRVSDCAHDLEESLRAIVWIDTAAARARYGRWIGGILPEFVPFPKTGRARGGSKKKGGAEESANNSTSEPEPEHFVYLRRLRHPLLLGDRLIAESLEGQRSRGGGASGREGERQRLPGWRPSSNNTSGNYSSGDESDRESSTESDTGEESALPPAPIPIDVTVWPGTKAVIITGPNTGGKTAALKALGLAVLMTKAGLPVPAADPVHLPCFDSVLADIGDEQSLSASLSTFSGHLKRIQALRGESSGKSLVLLDELGTGTDPLEGAALGISLLRALARGGPGGAGLTVATTHHSALTALKYEDSSGGAGKQGDRRSSTSGSRGAPEAPVFENASVEFDEAKMQPTYRVLWGVPGRSNALNIAERLGLDSEVIADARERLGVAATEVDMKIAELEELRKRQDEDEDACIAAEERLKQVQGKIASLSGSDPEYAQNLDYFIREAVKADDGCEYVIVLQESPSWNTPDPLPHLPRNARYLRHPNECFDLGTVGWVLRTQVDTRRYTYFVWLNSSVRGPFLPSYVRGRLHWTRPLTSKLTSVTKLVGATINCGGAQGRDPEPHVQSYLSATDSTGLALLLSSPSVFRCYPDMSSVVVHSEIGASRVILDAGYNLDSLMLRYQGLDWRSDAMRDPKAPCNEGLNPLQPGFYDGTDIDPLEVMFVKVKETLLEAKWKHAEKAVALADWVAWEDSDEEDAVAASKRNAWLDLEGGLQIAETEALARGEECFDWQFYLKANAYDLQHLAEAQNDAPKEAWEQFINMGIYEGRPHRWTRRVAEERAEAEVKRAQAIVGAVRIARGQLAQLKKTAAQKAAMEAAAAQAEASLKQDASSLRKQKAAGWVPSIGDFVFVPRLNTRAKVIAVDACGVLTLQAGLMKVAAAVDEVRKS